MQLDIKRLIDLQENEFVLLGLVKKKKCCEQDLLTLENDIENLKNELQMLKQKVQSEEQRYKIGELQLIADEETLTRQKEQLYSIKKTNDFIAMETFSKSLSKRISDQQDQLIAQLEILERLREQFALKAKSVNAELENIKNQQQQLQNQDKQLADDIQQQRKKVETFSKIMHGKFYDAYCVLKNSGKAYPWVVHVTEKRKCSGCFLSLSREAIAKLQEMKEPQFCEQCGRILYEEERLDVQL